MKVNIKQSTYSIGAAITITLLSLNPAFAETKVHPHASKDTVIGNCKKMGGKPIEGSGVYGCILPSGTRVGCEEGGDECISWDNPNKKKPSNKKQFGTTPVTIKDNIPIRK